MKVCSECGGTTSEEWLIVLGYDDQVNHDTILCSWPCLTAYAASIVAIEAKA